jgi:hypothetical protein
MPHASNPSNVPAPLDQPAGNNTLAVLSLLFGIGGFVPPIGIFGAFIAIITGVIVLLRSRGSAPRRNYRALAIAGIVLGGAELALYLLVVLMFSLPPGTYRIF